MKSETKEEEEDPESNEKESNSEEKNDELQEKENLINQDLVSEDLIEKLESEEVNKSENIEFSDGSDDSNIEFASKPLQSSANLKDFKYKVYTTKFDNTVNANKICDVSEIIKAKKAVR